MRAVNPNELVYRCDPHAATCVLRGAEYTNLVWDGIVGATHLDDGGTTWIFERNGEHIVDPLTGCPLIVLALSGRGRPENSFRV